MAHHVFCPRRAWLEVAGEHTDTQQMAAGTAAHRVTDDPRRRPAGVARAVDVHHQEWGYVGRCDTVHRRPDGMIDVIEYKATPVRRQADVTEAMRVQVTLQVEALESMGERVHSQAVYFTDHQQRVELVLTEDDRTKARQLVDETRTSVSSATAPLPLIDDAKCFSCSHSSVCLPEERKLEPIVRRIRVADPDSHVVHLTVPGSRASIRSGRLVVQKAGENLASVPLERVQGVVVHGNIDLSSGLIPELLWRSLSVVWTSGAGRVIGWAGTAASPNGSTRVTQHVASAHGLLELSKEFVNAKISNQATFLRRNGNGVDDVVAAMRRLATKARSATNNSSLFGVEGEAAALYFGVFGTMLRSAESASIVRTRRPATDPVNAALNYAYSLLTADMLRAVAACGLDPHAGFLHSSNRNKPALVLDLIEEFRAPVADSTVVRAFNNGEIGLKDFYSTFGTFTLRDPARRSLIAAYERRVQTTFTHPTFSYEVTWRRAMEIQARQVLGVLDGSQPRYEAIRIR